MLSGDGGIINATGDVIVGGTISPGNSPGRIRINCNLISLAGSNLILDIAYDGENFQTDQLIIDNDSTFNLQQLNIVFNFLGDADPTLFADAGLLNLDTFLREGLGGNDSFDNTLGLSDLLTQRGLEYSDVVDSDLHHGGVQQIRCHRTSIARRR